MSISELICEVIFQYDKAFGNGASKTKLLKLAYLAEVYYKRRYGKRLTSANWVYLLYGPYISNYDEILQNKNIVIKNIGSSDENETQVLLLNNTYKNETVPLEIKFMISSIVRDYGKLDLKNILDYVYFETEPMINAEKRGEILDFGSVLPEEYYKIKKLEIDTKTKRKLRADFKKRVEAIRGKRND